VRSSAPGATDLLFVCAFVDCWLLCSSFSHE